MTETEAKIMRVLRDHPEQLRAMAWKLEQDLKAGITPSESWSQFCMNFRKQLDKTRVEQDFGPILP
jgi:hypothetical protein